MKLRKKLLSNEKMHRSQFWKNVEKVFLKQFILGKTAQLGSKSFLDLKTCNQKIFKPVT